MKRPIIALDFSNKKEVDIFLANFPENESLFVKVGMELFYQEGPNIVTWLKSLNHDVFLDLKLHDIPNTVESAMRGLGKLGVDMTNVHAAGGKEMMIAARRGLEAGASQFGKTPILIAVTQLTSTSNQEVREEQLIIEGLEASVCQYAKIANDSGLDGVVCSALEVDMIKQKTRKDFVCLTPGIRPNLNTLDDQKRTVTPQMAREIGSTFIVVGRPITKSDHPYESYLSIKKQWSGE